MCILLTKIPTWPCLSSHVWTWIRLLVLSQPLILFSIVWLSLTCSQLYIQHFWSTGPRWTVRKQRWIWWRSRRSWTLSTQTSLLISWLYVKFDRIHVSYFLSLTPLCHPTAPCALSLVCAFHQITSKLLNAPCTCSTTCALWYCSTKTWMNLCLSSSVRLSIVVSRLFPHSPPCSILRHTWGALPTSCSFWLPWILSLSVNAQHTAEVRFVVSTWPPSVSFYFIPSLWQASLKTKQLQQSTLAMIEQAALFHPHSSSLHSWVINDQRSNWYVSCFSSFHYVASDLSNYQS